MPSVGIKGKAQKRIEGSGYIPWSRSEDALKRKVAAMKEDKKFLIK